MISVFIDTQQISEQFNINQDQIDDLVDYTIKEITYRFAQEWENEANRTLKSSRQEYISNINVVDDGFAKGSVVLTGWLPNSIEDGLDSFDIKEGHLNSKNAKVGADGKKYSTVPFAWGTPGALKENFSNIMPKEIHGIMKSKLFDTPIKGGGVASKPLSNDEIPKQFRESITKKVKLTNSEYTHKSSLFEGIRKQKDPVTKQNSYVSFRRISENSDPSSWIHPGIEAVNLAEKALDNFDIGFEAGKIFDNWWGNNF